MHPRLTSASPTGATEAIIQAMARGTRFAVLPFFPDLTPHVGCASIRG
ncbi:MAG: hypothetical protein NC241_09785 [Bacteroides sp.]|nr:hypothetical protein [Bacteroides sp.]